MELLLTTLITTITTFAISFFKKYPLGALLSTFGMVVLTALIGFSKVSLEALKDTKDILDKKNNPVATDPNPQQG